MITIRCVYHEGAPNFPATDQHPEAVRYRVGPYWVDAIGGEPTLAEVEAITRPAPSRVAGRTRLAGDVTFYVSPAGSDAAGDGSPGNPWRQPTFAYNAIRDTLDLAGFNARVMVASGGYGPFMARGPCLSASGPGAVRFTGNLVDPQQVNCSGENQTGITARDNAMVAIEGFMAVAAHAGGVGILCENAHLVLGNTVHFVCGFAHMQVVGTGQIQGFGTHRIVNSSMYHALIEDGGKAWLNNITYILDGTLGFNTFALGDANALIDFTNTTFTQASGSTAGKQFDMSTGATLRKYALVLPGNAAGVADTGYVI